MPDTTDGPPIDVVITWVDGSLLVDLEAWKARAGPGTDASSLSANRWRDNGELRFALRSIADNAPWVNQIHLVTDGTVPAWLDQDAPGLRVVSHREIFPDPGQLPTFNSAAIEAVLHRIPGLARHFLYFNDDIVFGRPVDRCEFLTDDGGTVVYVEPWPPLFDLKAPNLVDRQLARNQLVLGRLAAPMLAHSPQLFDRDRLQATWDRYFALQERTISHRFRAQDDALIRTLYFTRLLAEGPPHRTLADDNQTILVQVGPNEDVVHTLRRLRRAGVLSMCFNDDVVDMETDGWRWDLTRSFLAERFPRRSPFERRD